MDIEISAEAKNKKLNQMVAITVLALSVFLGITKIKDDNLVQGMQLAKADAVDTWGEYQATKTKLRIAQTAAQQMVVLKTLAAPGKADATAGEAKALDAEIAKYNAEAPELAKKAKALDARYDALNYHDDQFDMCDALASIAVSAAAVAALTESLPLLIVAWAFGGFGVFMGLAGIFGWMIHPDMISGWLA